MSPVFYALVAAAGNLAGAAALVRHEKRSLEFIEGCIAFGAGFMLAVALLEVAPQALLLGGQTAALYILGGYLVVHLAQHVLVPHLAVLPVNPDPVPIVADTLNQCWLPSNDNDAVGRMTLSAAPVPM